MKEGKLPKRLGQVLIHLQISHVSMRNKQKKYVLISWEYHKNVMPELCQLARVILAVPATQVCAERMVSVLRFIIPLQTHSMTADMLHVVLFH